MQPLVFTQGGLFIQCKIQINKFAFVMCESSSRGVNDWFVALPCKVCMYTVPVAHAQKG